MARAMSGRGKEAALPDLLESLTERRFTGNEAGASDGGGVEWRSGCSRGRWRW